MWWAKKKRHGPILRDEDPSCVEQMEIINTLKDHAELHG
jgi:hypothetical protein